MSPEVEIKAIQRMTNVYYAAYADLPTTNIRTGDLGYATDRIVFYRWSGTAWQPVSISSRSGLAANIGTAADYPVGSLYYATNTSTLYQQQVGSWVSISTPPPFATQTDVTGSRALNTAYQNTGGVPIGVLVRLNIQNLSSYANAFCDAVDATTEILEQGACAQASEDITIFFIVPNNWYYKVTLSSGTLAKWTEYS